MFKGAVTTVTAEVVGYRALRSQRKGSAWWTDEIKETIERKRRAYKKNTLRECGRNKTENENCIQVIE